MPIAPRFASQLKVVLPGSEKPAFDPSALAKVQVPAVSGRSARLARTLTVSVLVKPKQPVEVASLGLGAHLSRAEYQRQHGPDPTSVDLVKAFASEYGLTAASPESGSGLFHLSGPVAAMEHAFGVSLQEVDVQGAKYRVREGPILVPEELLGHVLAVLGLDNRPQARAQFRVAKPLANNVSYTPTQVAQLYGFPAGATAANQTIGLIELGGGFRKADVKAYFKTLGLPAPVVTAVSVDGGKNAPSTPSGADGEVMLDIEVCAAVAPKAKVAVYFAPNTDQGFVDAIAMAVHDRVNKPSVISISWGGPESSWTMQAMTALDAACQAAAVLGVTITAASGDNGSSDGVTGGGNVVDFPASSPHVLGCGGTKLTSSGNAIASEVVWNEVAAGQGATGGGVSAVFPLPTWQSGAKVPPPATSAGGRGVPDVAGDADPATGYMVQVDGQSLVIGGTSAVAPLWAGLIALANQKNKKAAGFVNPVLYGTSAQIAFRDITEGNNGAFTAGPGWDACTGLGSPNGTAVIALLATGAAKKPVKKVGKGVGVKRGAAKKSGGRAAYGSGRAGGGALPA